MNYLHKNFIPIPEGKHDEKPHDGWRRWCKYCNTLKETVDKITQKETQWNALESRPPYKKK